MVNLLTEPWSFLRSLLLSALIFAGTGIIGCTTRLPEAPTPTHLEPKGKTGQQELQIKERSTADKGSSFELRELWVKEEHGQTRLGVKFNNPVGQFRHFSLSQPSRIVLDILEVSPRVQSEHFTIGTSLGGTLRISSGTNHLRLSIDVAAATVPPYVVQPEDGGLTIVIGSIDAAATAKREERLVHDGKRVFAKAGPKQEKTYTEPKVSLVFDKGASVSQIFSFLGEYVGKNIIVTPDVDDKKPITLNLKEPIPWDQALDLLIDVYGLGKEQVGNVIRISTLEQLTKDRNARAVAEKAKENEGPIETVYLSVNYAKVRDLAEKVQKIKSPAGLIVGDEQTNTIFVRDIRRVVEEAKAVVTKFDVRTPQVLIESNLIETNPSFARALGVRFSFTRVGTTIASDFTPGGGTAAAGVDPILSIFQTKVGSLTDLTATLTAAENEGLVKVVSRPSIATLNNVASTIQSLRILRIALPSSTNIASGSGAAAGTAVATEKISTGVILNVTPQVSSDGFILMTINVKSSSVAPTASPSSGANASGVIPFDEISREAIANVLVRDGETIVVGGILKDTNSTNESGIPWLKNIPVLGWLFKNNSIQKDFEEMMVFITPRIASAGSENLPNAEQFWREQMKKTEGKESATSKPPTSP